jgi:nitroreductase
MQHSWRGLLSGAACTAHGCDAVEEYGPLVGDRGHSAGTPMFDLHKTLDGNPWGVMAADWPDAGAPEEKLMFLLQYAVLAPSILNSQPWRFAFRDGRLWLSEDSSRRMPIVDPTGRESTISCGAALKNLRIAARSFGHELDVDIAPDTRSSSVLAAIRLGDPVHDVSDADVRLREAIASRRTTRSSFDETPVEPVLMKELEKAAHRAGVEFRWITDPQRKQDVAKLAAEAERTFLADDAFRHELRTWLLQRRNEEHESLREVYARMGMAAGHTPESRPHPDQATVVAADIVRDFAAPEAAAASQYALAANSPAIALFATEGDGRKQWLAAGEALEHALLLMSASGVSSSYLNPPIELPRLRAQVADVFQVTTVPQVLLRLGYAAPVSPTPRRALRDVLAPESSLHGG